MTSWKPDEEVFFMKRMERYNRTYIIPQSHDEDDSTTNFYYVIGLLFMYMTIIVFLMVKFRNKERLMDHLDSKIFKNSILRQHNDNYAQNHSEPVEEVYRVCSSADEGGSISSIEYQNYNHVNVNLSNVLIENDNESLVTGGFNLAATSQESELTSYIHEFVNRDLCLIHNSKPPWIKFR